MTLTSTDKPTLVMVVTLMKDDHGKNLFWIAQNFATAEAFYELSFWQTEVKPGEMPVSAAARCANEQFWGRNDDFNLGWQDFWLVGVCETESHKIEMFYMPWLLHPDMLKPGVQFAQIPVDMVQSYLNCTREPSRTAMATVKFETHLRLVGNRRIEVVT